MLLRVKLINITENTEDALNEWLSANSENIRELKDIKILDYRNSVIKLLVIYESE